MTIPQGPNQRWSLDFVHDRLTNGRSLRLLTVHDDYTRECLWIEVDTSLSGPRVARVLDQMRMQGEEARRQRKEIAEGVNNLRVVSI